MDLEFAPMMVGKSETLDQPRLLTLGYVPRLTRCDGGHRKVQFPAGYDCAHKVMLHTGCSFATSTKIVQLLQIPNGRQSSEESPSWKPCARVLTKVVFDA